MIAQRNWNVNSDCMGFSFSGRSCNLRYPFKLKLYCFKPKLHDTSNFFLWPTAPPASQLHRRRVSHTHREAVVLQMANCALALVAQFVLSSQILIYVFYGLGLGQNWSLSSFCELLFAHCWQVKSVLQLLRVIKEEIELVALSEKLSCDAVSWWNMTSISRY